MTIGKSKHTVRSARAGVLLLLLALVVALFSLTCSNTTTQTQPAQSSQPPQQVKVARPTLAAASLVPPPGPVSGTLNLYSSQLKTLDPATSSDEGTHYVVQNIFSGLVCLNDAMTPCSDIAENCTISEDGKTYTFSLKPDVRFHDGRAVTADDFKYSWERACKPETNSPTAQGILGDIVGVNDMLSGKVSTIAGITVVDNATLRVTLEAPKPYFFYKLTYPVAFVVDRANVAAGDAWWHTPNGTGPFKLSKYGQGESFTLQRNPSYYGEKAKIEAVNYHILEGHSLELYEKSNIDVAEVGTSYIDMATDNSSHFSKELIITPVLETTFVGFNCKSPPFDDENVRLAFAQSIDKNKVVRLTLRSMSKQANSMLPPVMPGYDSNFRGQEFDPVKAKEFLAKSKYAASLPHITMTMSGLGNETTLFQEAIIAEWRTNLGVEVEIRQMEPERFIDHLKAEKDQMFLLDWVADYPHPQAILGTLFASDSEQNYGEFTSAMFNSLLAKAAQESDSEQGASLYGQADKQLIEEAGCIPLVSANSYVLVKPYVKGYALDVQGIVHLNRVSVESH
jgi:oligopeptide transport system substrate-binding protein